MIENLNDVISIAVIVGLLAVMGYFNIKTFLHHRQRRIIEEEIEYYKEW